MKSEEQQTNCQPSRNGSNGEAAAAAEEDDDWYDELELVVQGREIVVSERLLCKHSRYFEHIFGDIDPDAETVVLKYEKLMMPFMTFHICLNTVQAWPVGRGGEFERREAG